MKQKFLQFAVAIIALLAITACNESSNDLLNCIPADADVIAVGNPEAFLKSAGGEIKDSKIKLPTAITDLMSERDLDQLDELNSMLKDSGIDYNNVAFVLRRFKDSYPVIIFVVNDSKKFKSKIEDLGFSERDDEDGVVYYRKKDSEYDSSYFAINGKIVYSVISVWNESDFNPIKAIQKMISEAKDESFGSTPYGKFISGGNAFGLSLNLSKELRQAMRNSGLSSKFMKMIEGRICMTMNLESDKAVATFKWLDDDGNAIKIDESLMVCNLKAKIDKKALSLLGKNEQLVLALSMEDVDWDKYFDMLEESLQLSRSDRAQMAVVKAFLEKVDGTIAIGCGITNGIESIAQIACENNIFDNLSFTFVLPTKDGKSKSLMNDIKDLMHETGLPIEETSNGIILNVPGTGEFYAQAIDNYIVCSTNKPSDNSGNNTVKSLDFDKYLMAMGCVLDSDSKLMKDFDIDQSVKAFICAMPTESMSEMSLEIKGGPEGLIAKIIDMGLKINGQERKLSNRINEIVNSNSKCKIFDAE